ncbi:MAG TPA: hypothetical protein VGC88_00235 [Terriglobales bacterium]|jgi:hypothetical protein
MSFDARGVGAIGQLLEVGYLAAVKDGVVVLRSPDGHSLITVPQEIFDGDSDFLFQKQRCRV